MSLTQTAQSSRVGSGMFDKLPGSEGAKMQQKCSFIILGRIKLFLLCMHMHTSTNLSYVTLSFCSSVLVDT